jgi:hypothetical protein
MMLASGGEQYRSSIIKRFMKQIHIFIVFILNIYFLDFYMRASMLIYDPLIRTLSLVLVVIWFIGLFFRKTYISNLYYVLIAGLLVIENIGSYNIIYYSLIACLWMPLSNTLTDMILNRSINRRHHMSLKGVIIMLALLIGIYGVYVFSTYYVALLTKILIKYIIDYTPSIFQSFYNILLSTRIGSLVVFVISLFIIYYILDTYFVGLLSDILFLNKGFVIDRIKSLLYTDALRIIRGRDIFQKIYVYSMLFIISFYMYGLLYPVLNMLRQIIHFSYIPEILWAMIWFSSSYMVYGLLYNRIKNIVVPTISFPREILGRIRGLRSNRLLFISLTPLLAYLVLFLLLDKNLNTLYNVFMASLGLRKPVKYGVYDHFTSTISYYYTYYSNMIINYIENYFYSVSQSYIRLSKLLKELIEFLWG